MKIQLKRLRKAAGFKNRRQFSDALGEGYTERQVTSWETGERMLSLEQACDCADLLDCTLDELAGRDFSPPAYSDPYQAELNRCWERSDAQNRNALLVAARNAALASGGAAERADDAGEVVSA